MREVFSFIFERLTDPLGLPVSPLYEYLILAIIGLVAYEIAFSTVGGMYRRGEISSSMEGSVFHWIIRLIWFVVIWAVTYGIIAFAKWVTAHWVVIVSVLGGILLTAGIVAIIILIKKVMHHERNEK